MRKIIPLYLVLFFSTNLLAQNTAIKTIVQKGHEAVVKSAVYSPDGSYLFTASRDQTVKMWEVATKREIKSFAGHTSTVNDLAISGDGKSLATSSADKTAAVWDIITGALIFQTPQDAGYMTTVDISTNGKMLVTGGYDAKVKIWDIESRALLAEIPVNPDKGLGLGVNLVLSPNDRQLAIGEDNRLLKIYDVGTWDTLYTVPATEGWCGGCATFAAYDVSAKLLVKAVNNGAVTLHNAADGKLLKELSAEEEDVRSVQFDTSGKRVLLATEKSIIQWSVKTGEELLRFDPSVKAVNDAVYAPGGKEITVSGNDDQASNWSATDGD
ncbi:MAG: WD40 repeat domain-containing protein, partial [Bacteroidota bacterium]